jgi:hypothetical protein
MDVERSLESAYALGARNKNILDLLYQHCAHARDEQTSGQGLAEAASGLPINMRTIRCQYAKNPVGMAMDMEWIALDFYRSNCVGCPDRQMRGVPNLATYADELDKKAQHRAESDAQRADAVERRRKARSDTRSALATGESAAAAGLLPTSM